MSWDTLKVIADENRKSWAEVDRTIPSICPLCGLGLRSNPRLNIRDCPMGHYQWPGSTGYSWRDGVV